MKFILIQKQKLSNSVVNITTKAFFYPEEEQVVETVSIDDLREAIKVPPQELNITIKGRYFTTVLIKTITPAYLRGTKITVNGVVFPTCTINPQYFYTWQTQVPKSLPQHLKDAYYARNLRGELFTELANWNNERIQKAINASKFKWSLAEEFYKQLYKALTPKGICVMSPNKKTFYEATAEMSVDAVINPQENLTIEEIDYLTDAENNNYTKAFGLQDITVQIGYHHRTTPNGTTEEPFVISSQDIDLAITNQVFRKKTGNEAESYIDDTGFEVKSWNSTDASTIACPKKARENIETLKWFLSLDKETQKEFLLPGWSFCPVCGKLYHEKDGCDGHIDPIEFVPYNENHDEEDEDGYELT